VYRTVHGWLLKYELAGVLPREIQVTVAGRRVVVRGVRRDVRFEELRQSYSMEISYNQFERALELPCDLDAMRVDTDYRDGMLIVRLICEDTDE
jgi:HSP20 family protein